MVYIIALGTNCLTNRKRKVNPLHNLQSFLPSLNFPWFCILYVSLFDSTANSHLHSPLTNVQNNSWEMGKWKLHKTHLASGKRKSQILSFLFLWAAPGNQEEVCRMTHTHTPLNSLIVGFLLWNLINWKFLHLHASPHSGSRGGSCNTRARNRCVHIPLTQERKLLAKNTTTAALLGPGDLDTVDRHNFLCCGREQNNSSAGWDHYCA